MNGNTTNDDVFYAPPETGLTLARHALQGVVSHLLTRAHNSTAIGKGAFDPELISACWLLNIRCTPFTTLQVQGAAAQLANVRAILGDPVSVVEGYACFELTPDIRTRLIALATGGCHAERL